MLKSVLLELLQQGLLKNDLVISPVFQEKLVNYIELLHKWNAIHNLTAVRDPKEMIYRHVLDSLMLYPILTQSTTKTVIDVGTGPGLPGIVLAICLPNLSFTLIDSHQKKMNFVKHVVLSQQLSNVSLVCERVEQYHPEFKFGWVISRAFASLEGFAENAGHLCADEGRMVAMKGRLSEQEVAALPREYTIEQCKALQMEGISSERCLVFIKKIEERSGFCE
jgi:16S rRNA (guanine527-N7)-methyltransferase